MPNTIAPLTRERSLDEFRRVLRENLPELKRRFAVDYLGVFGSFVHGEQRPDSDLDVLVDFSKAPSFFKLVEMELHLADLLGIKVDLVPRSCLKPIIGKRILAEVIEI